MGEFVTEENIRRASRRDLIATSLSFLCGICLACSAVAAPPTVRRARAHGHAHTHARTHTHARVRQVTVFFFTARDETEHHRVLLDLLDVLADGAERARETMDLDTAGKTLKRRSNGVITGAIM